MEGSGDTQSPQAERCMGVAAASPPPLASWKGGHREALVAGALLIAAVAWYRPLAQHKVMMGDDVHVFQYFHEDTASVVTKCLLSAPSHKYRPVYNVCAWLQLYLLGADYQLIVWCNILLYAGITYLLYSLLMKVTNADVLTSAILAVLFLTSRFAFYHISEVNGLLEQLCLLWILVIGHAGCAAYRDRTVSMLCLAGLSFLFLVFTHERFMACTPFFLVALWYTDWLSTRSKLLLVGVFLAPALFHIAIKTLAFASPVLMGTAGKAIEFDWETIATHGTHAMLNVIGINSGPAYLAGVVFPLLPEMYKAFSIIGAGIVTATLLASWCEWAARGAERRILLATAVLLGCLIAAASITIRLEHRWLLAPLLVLLVYVGHALPRLSSPAVRIVAMLGLLVTGVLTNRFFLTNRHDLYMFSSRRVADAFYEASIQRFGSDTKTFYVKQSFDTAAWVISPNLFFAQFALPTPVRMRYYERDEELKEPLENPDRVVVLEYRQGTPARFVDVTAAKLAEIHTGTTVFDCYAEFPNAETTSDRNTSYPWGESIVRLEPPATSSPAIFIGGGGSIRYTLQLPMADELFLRGTVEYFDEAKGWGVSDGAIVTATAKTADREESLFSIPIAPADERRTVQGSLSAFRGQRCEIEITVTNGPGHTDTGDWIVVRGLGVVEK